jgi:hypothetical protein
MEYKQYYSLQQNLKKIKIIVYRDTVPCSLVGRFQLCGYTNVIHVTVFVHKVVRLSL